MHGTCGAEKANMHSVDLTQDSPSDSYHQTRFRSITCSLQNEVQNVLDCFEETFSLTVKANTKLICKFMNELSLCLKEEKGILKGARIRASDIFYQNLTTNPEGSYDIILELGEPFISSNYQITQHFCSKYVHYKLKARERKTEGRKMLCNMKKIEMAYPSEEVEIFYCKKKKTVSFGKRYEVANRKTKNKKKVAWRIDRKKTLKENKLALIRIIDKKSFKMKWKPRAGHVDMKRKVNMETINKRERIRKTKVYYRKIVWMAGTGEIGTTIVYGQKINKLAKNDKINTDMFCSKKKNLKTLELRSLIFARLTQILSSVKLSGVRVTCCVKSLALELVLHTSHGRRLKVDLMPHITVGSWEECPGLVAWRTLPQCLQDYITTSAASGSAVLYIIPAFTPAPRSAASDVCCMVGCSMLENHFLMKERNIHDMVRLASLVKDYKNWTIKFGIKSFHLKRIAIKNAAKLSNMTTWDGFKALVQYLHDEVQQGGVSDCFVQGHLIYCLRNSWKLERLQSDIREVQQWKPETFIARLTQTQGYTIKANIISD